MWDAEAMSDPVETSMMQIAVTEDDTSDLFRVSPRSAGFSRNPAHEFWNCLHRYSTGMRRHRAPPVKLHRPDSDPFASIGDRRAPHSAERNSRAKVENGQIGRKPTDRTDNCCHRA